jgi:hypothetical protein
LVRAQFAVNRNAVDPGGFFVKYFDNSSIGRETHGASYDTGTMSEQYFSPMQTDCEIVSPVINQSVNGGDIHSSVELTCISSVRHVCIIGVLVVQHTLLFDAML